MAATLQISPPFVALSQEPLQVRMQTDKISGIKASVQLNFTSAATATNDTLTLTWSGNTVIFTFRALPNSSGYQLPVASTLNDAYFINLIENFRQNDLLSNDFIVSYFQSVVTIAYRTTDALSVLATTTSSAITISTINSAGFYAVPNLTGLLKIVRQDETPIAKFNGNYVLSQVSGSTVGICDFDLINTFDIATNCPSDASLSPFGNIDSEIATRTFIAYKLRFADKYGIPPISESLISTNVFYSIFGGRSIISTKTFLPDSNGIYLCQPNLQTNLTRNQPGYLNIFTTQDLGICTIALNLHLKNGNNFMFFVSHMQTNLSAFNLYQFRMGLSQFNLTGLSDYFINQSDILLYDFKILDRDTGSILKFSHTVILNDDCKFNSLYLLYGNGFGGVNTLHVQGGYSQKTENTQTLITKYALKTDSREGNFGNVFATINDYWEVQTGLMDVDAAHELRQLLVADLWLIDTVNYRFLKVFSETKIIETKARTGTMVSLGLTLKSAWKDLNAV